MEHLDNSLPWLPGMFSHLNHGIFAVWGFYLGSLKEVSVCPGAVLLCPGAGQGWLGIGDLSCAPKGFTPQGMALMGPFQRSLDSERFQRSNAPFGCFLLNSAFLLLGLFLGFSWFSLWPPL